MKLLLLCCVLFILGCIHYTESKRGGGGRGGGRAKSTGSSGWYSRDNNKKGSSNTSRKTNTRTSQIDAVSNSKVASPSTRNLKPSSKEVSSYSSSRNVKQSAFHPELRFKKESSHIQQSSNTQQKPIGWNIQPSAQQSSRAQQKSIGWNVQNGNQKGSSSQQSSRTEQKPNGWNVQNGNQQGVSVQQASKTQKKSVGWNVSNGNQQAASKGNNNDQGGSGWFWRNGNKKGSSSNRKSNAGAEGEAVPNPKSSSSVGNAKASAPNPEPGFKKETSHVQQSSNTQQRPIGWNVQNGNPNQQGGAWKGGYNQAHQSPVGNQPQGAWGGGHQGYPQQNNYQGFNRGYSGYPQQSGYNPYNGYNSQPGYHGYSGYGGYGGHGGYGGYGGHGGYGGGGGFGGGYGGGMSGGYGGMGGPMGMYGMKKKSSFFSGGTVSNVLAGMFVYHMASNLVGGLFGRSKPYTVYNYYNQPAVKEEIKLPANILTLCEGNATSFCTKGLIPICTTNNTVLCVATMSQASPCGEENALCVNTSIPCTDKSDPVCSNTTITQNKEEAPMSLPCFTNLTMDINLLNETGPNSGDYKYCVTAMAIAGPEYKNCTDDAEKSIDGYRSVLAGDYTWFLTVDKMKRPYTVHNYQHPPGETPKGDIVMPLPILAPCIDNAKTLCAPGLLSMCTNFGEILCLEVLSSVPYCEDLEATCFTSTVPCLENDPLCQNKTEEEVKTDEKGQNVVSVKLPCFANITINTNLPDFDIHQFNGTIPEGTNTSFMYHYHYCITTLGLPGNETDACIIKS